MSEKLPPASPKKGDAEPPHERLSLLEREGLMERIATLEKDIETRDQRIEKLERTRRFDIVGDHAWWIIPAGFVLIVLLVVALFIQKPPWA